MHLVSEVCSGCMYKTSAWGRVIQACWGDVGRGFLWAGRCYTDKAEHATISSGVWGRGKVMCDEVRIKSSL